MYQIATAVVAAVVSCWCAAEASEAVLGFSCDAQGMFKYYFPEEEEEFDCT
jgi:hypothetical protein